MSAEKSPAFQFYPKEFLTDGNVAVMSLAERGAYITLLCICWQEGSLPSDPVRLARIVGIPTAGFKKLWPALSVCFQSHPSEDGRLIQGRLERERQKQRTFSKQQRDRGLSRTTTAVRDESGQFTTQPAGRPAEHPAATPADIQPDDQPRHQPPDQPERSRAPALRSPYYVQEQDLKRETPDVLPRPALVQPAATCLSLKCDPFTNQDTANRAAAFIERYQPLYQKHRKGARYAVRPARDYAAAVTLCTTWPDERLDKLAVIFLTTDHSFAEEGSRTIPQFLALASWCDGRLAEHDASNGHRS